MRLVPDFLSAVRALIIPVLVAVVVCCTEASSRVADTPQDSAESRGGLLGMNTAKWMDDDLEHALALMQELTVKWVRSGVAWERIEPFPGKYDWKRLDRMVNMTKDHNLHLLITLRAFNPWAGTRMPEKQTQPQSHRAATPPKNLAQFARFVGGVAARYRGSGVCWQIENEPNLSVYWLGTREEYARLLKAGYAAIHQADPGAVVVSGGIACEFFEHTGVPQKRLAHLKPWFDAVFESKSYDAIDMHNYFIPERGNPWGLTFGEYIRAVKSWMKEKDVAAPLWITEFAFPSGPLTVKRKNVLFTPDHQARFLRQAALEAKAEGVQHLFWMFMRDTAEGQGNHLGLAARNGKPKKAWDEFIHLEAAEKE